MGVSAAARHIPIFIPASGLSKVAGRSPFGRLDF